ncbi:AraC family transcriptional regulator [Pseudomonas synxantha]|nr:MULTISPECIES: GlxA family transcriptional regulator [Pseudomonas]AMS22595.1 AraC family transcriptional regulator [Pseudomonas synxantha]KRA15764.1 AraC family transcriptional regulator [Pseudomonas sp. Root569]MDT3230775.1 GlxA family transcriptional regulator [Pseudomonas sp. rhizo25]WDG40472.1 GlxA family transcriptional regulator [Pseudomonas synxantha]
MKIALLAPPRIQMLDLVGPTDVFAEAARQLGKPRTYRIAVIGVRPGPIKGTSGLRVETDDCIETFDAHIDTLLIAGSPAIGDITDNLRVLHWVRRQAGKARRVGSVCSGAFVLAAAGLLAGRRATTHWNSSAALARQYPNIQVDADSIFIRDGNLYTSAGITAGMDLALALVEEDHGRDLALSVAREMVMYLKRPGGQSQFSAQLAAQSAERNAIRDIQHYIIEHLATDLSVPLLARHMGMSERNFARVFKADAGQTPAEFVERARIDGARQLLDSADVSLKRLANQVGYANVDGFRRAFVRRLGISPNEYRKIHAPQKNAR